MIIMVEVLKDGLAYREVPCQEYIECVIVEIYRAKEYINIKLIHLYNHCKKWDINQLNKVAGTVYRN